jgi:hypothetical protein
MAPMADDSPFPSSKRGTNPRSLANLRPPCKPGEVLNPEGKNGRTRAEFVAAFLEEIDATEVGQSLQAKIGCPGATRIKALLHRDWLAGMDKSDVARKSLIEQYAGRPKQQVDLTSNGETMSGVFVLPAGPATAEEWEKQHGPAAETEPEGDESSGEET